MRGTSIVRAPQRSSCLRRTGKAAAQSQGALKFARAGLDNAGVTAHSSHLDTSPDAGASSGDTGDTPPADGAAPHDEQQAHDPARTSTPTSDFASKRVFTTGEAAVICKVSQQTIIRCFDNGRLAGFKVPGSKFRRIPREELVRFMKANAIPLENLPGEAPAQGPSGAPVRILAVDDDPAMLAMYEDIVAGEARLELHTASTGYDAGLRTIELRPRLILLDYLLPDINGNLVCKRVRERPELGSTRVLIVSGVVQQSQIDELLRSGADGVLRKPFEIAELARLIRELLKDDALLKHRL
jgi:two-component system, OmpR family, response regulator